MASLAAAEELPLERHRIRDPLGRELLYYMGTPKHGPAPVLLMIQGSGCVPVLNVQPGGTYSTLFNLVPFAQEGEFTVIAVEKPFAAPGSQAGTADGCSPAFNEDFNAERWLVALRAVLDDAMASPSVDPRRVLAFGVSEGAVMAALLAGRDARVTDVVFVGGSGTTQLFDFIAFAYRRCFDASECMAKIERNVRAIRAKPDSATDFAWGHPYKRWSSFFAVDPAQELLRSKARVYMAFGTADEAVPALSAEVAVATLEAAGRDITVRRVPNAGHSLRQESGGGWAELDREYRAALDWFRKGPRP